MLKQSYYKPNYIKIYNTHNCSRQEIIEIRLNREKFRLSCNLTTCRNFSYCLYYIYFRRLSNLVNKSNYFAFDHFILIDYHADSKKISISIKRIEGTKFGLRGLIFAFFFCYNWSL
jgi:hypothetical protein